MAKSGSARSSALRVAVLAFSAVLAIQGLIPPAPTAAKEVAKLTTIRNTNFVSTGVGNLRADGTSSVALSGVTGTLTKALLYWNGRTTLSDPSLVLNVKLPPSPSAPAAVNAP